MRDIASLSAGQLIVMAAGKPGQKSYPDQNISNYRPLDSFSITNEIQNCWHYLNNKFKPV